MCGRCASYWNAFLFKNRFEPSGYRPYWIITVRQRSCGKVMFSQVFVCPREGVAYLWFQVPSLSLVPCPFWGGYGISLPCPFLEGGGGIQGIGYAHPRYPTAFPSGTTKASGTHPTGMLSCSWIVSNCRATDPMPSHLAVWMSSDRFLGVIVGFAVVFTAQYM